MIPPGPPLLLFQTSICTSAGQVRLEDEKGASSQYQGMKREAEPVEYELETRIMKKVKCDPAQGQTDQVCEIACSLDSFQIMSFELRVSTA